MDIANGIFNRVNAEVKESHSVLGTRGGRRAVADFGADGRDGVGAGEGERTG